MHPPTSVLALSSLLPVLVARVVAMPAPVAGGATLLAPRAGESDSPFLSSPSTSVKCEMADPDCECFQTGKVIRYLCGYADKDWHTEGKTRRSMALSSQILHPRQNPPAAGSGGVPLGGSSLNGGGATAPPGGATPPVAPAPAGATVPGRDDPSTPEFDPPGLPAGSGPPPPAAPQPPLGSGSSGAPLPVEDPFPSDSSSFGAGVPVPGSSSFGGVPPVPGSSSFGGVPPVPGSSSFGGAPPVRGSDPFDSSSGSDFFGPPGTDSSFPPGSDPFGAPSSDPFDTPGSDPFGPSSSGPLGQSSNDPFEPTSNDPFGPPPPVGFNDSTLPLDPPSSSGPTAPSGFDDSTLPLDPPPPPPDFESALPNNGLPATDPVPPATNAGAFDAPSLPAPVVPAPPAPSAAPTGPPAPRPPPQVLNATSPLFSALQLIWPSRPLQNVASVVLNKVTPDTREHFVQGLTGTTATTVSIASYSFPAGSRWMLRWDFAWYGENNSMPPSGQLGPHVTLVVEDVEGQGKGTQANFAIFFKDGEGVREAKSQGDWYFEKVLDPMRGWAGWQADGASSGKFMQSLPGMMDAVKQRWDAFYLKASVGGGDNPGLP